MNKSKKYPTPWKKSHSSALEASQWFFFTKFSWIASVARPLISPSPFDPLHLSAQPTPLWLAVVGSGMSCLPSPSPCPHLLDPCQTVATFVAFPLLQRPEIFQIKSLFIRIFYFPHTSSHYIMVPMDTFGSNITFIKSVAWKIHWFIAGTIISIHVFEALSFIAMNLTIV